MTERAQALEAALREFSAKLAASSIELPADAARILRENLWELYEGSEAVPPPPPVGSPTTERDQLREALAAIQQSTRDDEKGEQWTIRNFLNKHGVFNDDISGSRRLVAEACRYVLSTPVEPAVTPTLQDALSALRYIRETHGALYGVGWDRLLPVEPAGASHTGWGPDKTRDCHCTACQGEPAGASEPPKKWIPTEGCTCYLCRAARLSPAPVSPVEPEPPAKCDVCFTAAHCHRHRRCLAECMPDDLKPTGAPAPCVWRDISTTQPAVDDIVLVYEEGHIGKALLDASGRWLDVEAGRDDAWFSVPPSHWMPFPTPPLTVER